MTATIDPAGLRGNWSYPTTVRFGPGRLAELPDACRALGIARPLLVTDPGLAELEMVRRTVALNEAAGLATAVFSGIRSNPTGGDIDAGVEAYRAGGHDGVIAFGGGSALDAGKAIAFMVGQGLPIWEFEDRGDLWRKANAAGIAPVVAVPTTAGTGSEVGRAGVITDERTHEKKIIFHPRMLPGQVIADPEVTIALPPKLTAWTGFDALSHGLEALCAPGFHPMADGIAVECVRLVHAWLPRAVERGDDLAARAHMLAAAAMGAVAFQKGLGAMHALSHPVGGLLGAHHGLTNAVVMPYVLAYNRPVIGERMARVARTLDLPGAGFDAVYDWVVGLRRRLGIPDTLAELGVRPEHLERMAAMAAIDPTAGGNPRPVGVPELRALYESALGGG
ncbi:MAG TPA: iron-containing alcohol dehydrogenase [Geminicoccaceae bacterium]|nr:iron-containing alcohol dehydrogenase [Geminicoccaceae bacterium]